MRIPLTWILCGLVAAGMPAEAAEDVSVLVDPAVTYQTIDGFGASHRSLVYPTAGDVLSPDQRQRALYAVYHQIGVTAGNLDCDLLETPAGWAERANDNADPVSINWRGFQLFTAAAMKERVLDMARPLAGTRFYVAQKVNLRWRSPWLSLMRVGNHEQFLNEAAEQIVAGYVLWRDRYQFVSPYAMPFNEPIDGYAELDGATVEDMREILRRAGRRLRQAGFEHIRFVVPNDATPRGSAQIAEVLLADPEVRSYIGAIGYHAYPIDGGYASVPAILRTAAAGRPDAGEIAARLRIRDLAEQYRLPVWMTEVSNGGVDPMSFDALRGRAVHIHDELQYAHAAAYYGMATMWDATSQRLHFEGRRPEAEGNLVLIDQPTDRVQITGMGYAIGHYARWLPPGSVRIDAESSDALVQVTAARDPSGRLAMVVINNASQPRTIAVRVAGAMLTDGGTGEQSTADAAWRSLGAIAVDAAGWRLQLPGHSVTSVAVPMRVQRPSAAAEIATASAPQPATSTRTSAPRAVPTIPPAVQIAAPAPRSAKTPTVTAAAPASEQRRAPASADIETLAGPAPVEKPSARLAEPASAPVAPRSESESASSAISTTESPAPAPAAPAAPRAAEAPTPAPTPETPVAVETPAAPPAESESTDEGPTLGIGAPSSVLEAPVLTPPPAPRPPTQPSPAAALSLNADRTTVVAGEPVRLTWRGRNVERCRAFGGWTGPRRAEGEAIVMPARTTLYGIMCVGQGSPLSRYLMVTVAPSPSAPGASAAQSQASSQSAAGAPAAGGSRHAVQPIAATAVTPAAIPASRPAPAPNMPAQPAPSTSTPPISAPAVAMPTPSAAASSPAPAAASRTESMAPPAPVAAEEPTVATAVSTATATEPPPAEPEAPPAPPVPSVAIKRPADGATFDAPAQIAISASAVGVDRVERLSIAIDGVVLNECTERSCQATFRAASPGTYHITADVIDASQHTTAASVTIHVR